MKVRLQQLYYYVLFWWKFLFNNLSNLLLFSLCHTENLLLDQQSLVLVFVNSTSFFHNIGTIFFIPNFSRIKVPKLSHEIWAVLPPAHSPLSHIIYCHLFHLGGPWSTTGIILLLMPLIDTSLDQVKRTCTKYGPKWARAKYILAFFLAPQVP